MNANEVIAALRDGKIIKVTNGDTGRSYMFKFNDEKKQTYRLISESTNWVESALHVDALLNDDYSFEIVPTFGLTYRQALHAMIDGKQCLNERYPNVAYYLDAEGRFRYVKGHSPALFTVRDRNAKWAIVEV